MSGEKPKGIWDIDGVLALTPPAIAVSASHKVGRSLTVGHLSENFSAMLNLPKDELEQWWGDFCWTEFPRLHPVQGVAHVLQRFRQRADFDLENLTSRRPEYGDISWQWLSREYAGLFRWMHMAKIDWKNDPEAHRKTKLDDLLEIGNVAFVVDDEPKHTLAAAHAGIIAIRAWPEELAEFYQPVQSAPSNHYDVCGAKQLETVLNDVVLPLAA